MEPSREHLVQSSNCPYCIQRCLRPCTEMKVENRKNLLSGFCLASIVICYALFLKCYFPLKQGLGGYASITNLPPEPFSGRSDVPAPRYKRLVLMVIDALRTDFVLEESSSYMPFTRRLLRDGRGVAFAAKTHLPTVTLPRLKVYQSFINCRQFDYHLF